MEGLGGDGREEADPAMPALTESEVVTRLPGVTALILGMTRDFTLTKDLTQDVAIAVVTAIREGRIRQHDALTAYMHQAARNIVLANHRKMTPEILETLPEETPLWQQPGQSPEEVFEKSELNRLVKVVIASLPMERDRQLLYGVYVECLSKAELMHRLDMTADLYDKTLFRARSRMCEEIRKKMQEKNSRVEETSPSAVPVSGKSRS